MSSAVPRLHRSLEWVVALVLAVATVPVLVVLAAVSALVYRCSPVFVHERLGRHGRRFAFVKIRTLPPDMARYAAKHAIDEVHVPWVMRLIRRTHLDELPQLWLVVSGHLSLVGPRAEMAALHERIPPVAAAERLSVRPGVTGLWQVSAHCDGLICDRVEYDRLYVRHRNPLLDLWILWRTVQKVLLGRRIHLFEVPQWAIAMAPTPDVVIDLTAAPAPAPPLAEITLVEQPQPALSAP